MDQNDRSSEWDNGVYGTGPTKPPKNHNSAVTVLLILVIFLSGIVTVLSFLNIRMFQRLTAQQKEEDVSISFSAEAETEAAEEAEVSSETMAADSTPASEESAGVSAGTIETVPRDTLPVRTGDEDVSIDLNTTPTDPGTYSSAEELSLQEIYTRCIPSVVSITCSVDGGSASGTGVILSDQGYIVTNNHVVEGAREILVQLTDGRILSAEVVGTDSVSDLAVLYIEADDLTPAEFGDSDSLSVGDSVVAIGDPLGVEYRGTMTNGIISAINRNVTVNGRTMNLIQTNAALNSGNSGGPLINLYGQVIGINTMKIGAFTDDAGVEGIGFAIPSTMVREIVSQLITQGYVSGRPSIGITGEALNSFYQHYYRVPAGLYITEVSAGSCSSEAGIAAGDMLLTLDDETIDSMDSLNAFLYAHEVGDTVTAVIYRNGREYSVELTLDEATG